MSDNELFAKGLLLYSKGSIVAEGTVTVERNATSNSTTTAQMETMITAAADVSGLAVHVLNVTGKGESFFVMNTVALFPIVACILFH